jgi:hypothetical protein
MNSSGGSSRSRGRRATRSRYRLTTSHAEVAPICYRGTGVAPV